MSEASNLRMVDGAAAALDLQLVQQQLSPQWLTHALSERHPGVVVERAEVVRIMSGTCAKIWVDLFYAPDVQAAELPSRLLVKSGFGQYSDVMQFTYRLEMLSYRDVLQRFPIRSPRCFYAGPSPDGTSYAVILEDLTLRNVEFCDPLRPLNFDQATSFLTELGRFHALTWNHRALTDVSWRWVVESKDATRGLGAYLSHLLEPDVWAGFIALPRGTALPRAFVDRDLYLEALPRLSAFSDSQPQVLLHGDVHLGNLYIEPDGTPGFLDFQCRVGAWSLSVAYFINTAVDWLDRRAWDRMLVAHYLAAVTEGGAPAPDFEEAWDAYSRQLLFYLFGWLANASQFQPEARCVAVTTRLAAAIIDSGSLARIGGLDCWARQIA